MFPLAIMADYRDLIAAKAFSCFDGPEYNRQLEELTSEGSPLKDAVFYEVPLLEDRPWAYLRDQVYPKLVRFLKNRPIDPEEPENLVVTVFLRDRCFLLHGKKFLAVFLEMEELDSTAFHLHVLQWLSQVS